MKPLSDEKTEMILKFLSSSDQKVKVIFTNYFEESENDTFHGNESDSFCFFDVEKVLFKISWP